MFLLLSLTSSLARPIINGNPESGFPTVVALGADFNGNTFSACTGNLITPRIILTAAHCGGDLPLELVIQFGSAFWGDDVTNADYAIGFEDYLIHPDYRELGSMGPYDTGAYDISLLLLAEDATTPPSLFRSEVIDDTLIGTPLTSVGFGITGANQNDSGLKRSANVIMSDVDALFVEINNADNPDNANICSGDSGGPTFIFDEEREQIVQLAVHSWGDQTCTIQSGSTRTDIVSEWIFDYIEEVHGSRDICEINGLYSDGLCTLLPDCLQEDPECIVEEEEIKSCNQMGTAQALSTWLILCSMIGLRRRLHAHT